MSHYQLDTAQAIQVVSLLNNDAYANIAAVNAAVTVVDLQDWLKERALIVVTNEDAGADTTVSVEHSDASGSGFAAVTASILTDPVTGDTDTLANLNTAGVKTVAVDLRRCRRYLRIQVATELGAASAVAAMLVGQYSESPTS